MSHADRTGRTDRINHAAVTGRHIGPRAGYTLIETLFAVVILVILVSIVAVNLPGVIRKSRFDRDVAQFSQTLRIAAEQAIFRNQRLAIVIDVYDGYYTVYPANEQDRYTDELEPLIDRQGLDHCYIDDIEFEDGSHQYSGELIMYATPTGFGATVLMTLVDLDQQYLFLSCNRLTTQAVVAPQPPDVPLPQTELSLSTPI